MGYTILLRDLLAPIAEVILDRTLDGVARNLMVSALVVLVRENSLGESRSYLRASKTMLLHVGW